ncbi:MAG: GTP-binding protein, partial [Xanthomonadaceae bacterium]|nr:GTP-binding protein [Xanthomonadaceae bacterium]
MMAYSTADIRNIALVGPAGAGKTLLAEALLLEGGAIRSRGSLERGTTACDFDPQERALQHSLDAAIVHFDVDGCRINLIDTPGTADFVGRSLSMLEAVETAAVVVSAATGLEPVTQRMMEFARDRELCRIIVINKIDARDAHPERVLAELREAFGRECLPLNLPAKGRERVIDCFFQPGDGEPEFGAVAAAHTEIIDQVVEVDEKLMALYLEQGEDLSPEQLHDPFEQALREGHLVPVCFVSAETGAGVRELTQILARLMPNPLEGNPPPFLRGTGAQAERVRVTQNSDDHVIAHVFKVNIDPFVGRLGVLRVHQGTLRSGAQLFVGDARKPIKAAHLYQLQGKEHTEVPRAIPG